MVESTGSTGKGVMFQIDLDGSPVSWITIANARSLNFTGRQADEIDFTHLLSDSAYREMRQGFKDGGSIAIDYHFDIEETTHIGTAGLLGLFNDGAVFNWRLNFSSIAAFALVGRGFMQNPGDIDINVDGPISGAATVRVTGPSTVEAVS